MANSYKMMMLSGVIRPACLEIRRMPDVAPVTMDSYLPEFLNDLLHMSSDFRSKPNHMRGEHNRESKTLGARSSYHRTPPRFSLRAMLVHIGLLRPTRQTSQHEPPLQPNPAERLEERILVLESLLKAEQARNQAQAEELVQLRSRMQRMEEVQTDLTVEREAGELLVQWLQEAERQLAEADSGADPTRG